MQSPFKQAQTTTSQLLPRDLLVLLFQRMRPVDTARMALVCRAWHKLARSDVVWRVQMQRTAQLLGVTAWDLYNGNTGLFGVYAGFMDRTCRWRAHSLFRHVKDYKSILTFRYGTQNIIQFDTLFGIDSKDAIITFNYYTDGVSISEKNITYGLHTFKLRIIDVCYSDIIRHQRITSQNADVIDKMVHQIEEFFAR